MSEAPNPAEANESAVAPVPVAASEPVVESVIETDVTSDTVTVRRAPKYGRFMTIGGALGAVVALVLTLSFSPNPTPLQQDLGIDSGQVFGFMLLICGAIGVGIGALVALAFDRSLAKRTASVTVEHEVAHRVDETP
ncbi:potassium transporter Trk [Agromyces sp. Marseille-Q5079]|uniref:potassium transporter Trk n=1 Tax=Agromyces sp. Marseille-Q5079 TaxID=3439059 RepID=UPI003D9C9A3F